MIHGGQGRGNPVAAGKENLGHASRASTENDYSRVNPLPFARKTQRQGGASRDKKDRARSLG